MAAAGAIVGSAAFPPAARGEGHHLHGDDEKQFEAIRNHENAHVGFLVKTLGSDARPKPTFKNLQMHSLDKFIRASQTFENTGVGAYLGALPVIFSRAYVAAAGSIAQIEARHAGYLNVLLEQIMTVNVFGKEQSFERPLTITEVTNLAGPFIADLNGGPPLTFSPTPSAKNDIATLNFALALEYLEAEFYNLNVSRFT